MEPLSQLQLVNEYLIQESLEKDKFLQSCAYVILHCQCGIVSKQLIDDLNFIQNKINSEEYKNLFAKPLVSLDDNTTLQHETSHANSLSSEVSQLLDNHNEADGIEAQDDMAEGEFDVREQNDIDDDMTETDNLPQTDNLTMLREESVVSSSQVSYPTSSTIDVSSTSLDATECIIDMANNELNSAVEALGTVAIVTGEDGNVVVYEQVEDNGQMIVVTSEQAVELNQALDEITVLAQTASLQTPISDGVIEAATTDTKVETIQSRFVTEDEEKELLMKIETPRSASHHGEDRQYRCYICEKTFNKQIKLRDHMVTHDKIKKEKFKCSLCGKGFPKPYMVRSHMVTHGNLKPFECNVCNKKFSQKSCLTRHMKIHSQEKPYACSICDKRFNQFAHARQHMALHSESRHKCHLCPRTFPTIQRLQFHLALHDKMTKKDSDYFEEKPLFSKQTSNKDNVVDKYSCRYCPEKFSTKEELDTHDESHAEDRPFQCDICGIRCVYEKNLTKHRNCHSRTATHICEICGRPFKSESWLRNHLRQHNGVKPFMCQDCGEVFTAQASLTRHRVRRHNGQPNRNCSTCGQHFDSFKALRHHRTKVHADKSRRYKCKKCGESFASVMLSIKHLKTHMEEEKEISQEMEDEVGKGESQQEHEAGNVKQEHENQTQQEHGDGTLQEEQKQGVLQKDQEKGGLAEKPVQQTTIRVSSRIKERKKKGRVDTKNKEDSEDQGKENDSDGITESEEKGPMLSNMEDSLRTVTDNSGKLKKECPLCRKHLHPSSIYKHIQSHEINKSSRFTKSGQEKAPCSVCNKMISKTTVYTHMRIHKRNGDISEEAPNLDDGKHREPCDICGKLCTPQSLPKHKNIHLNVRPYSCDICGKRFNQKPHVSRHKKAKHPIL